MPMITVSRIATHALAITALLSTAAGGQVAGWDARTAGGAEQGEVAGPSAVGRAFARSMRNGVVDAGSLEGELRKIRPSPVPNLFAVLDRREVLIPRPDGLAVSHALDEHEATILEEVLVTAPAPAVRAHLRVLDRDETPRRTKDLGVWLLGRMGDPRDLDLVGRLARPCATGEILRRESRTIFATALEGIVRRHSSALHYLTDLFEEVVPALRGAVVSAIEGAHDKSALRTLSRLLGRDPRMDGIVLAAITRRGEREALPVDEDIRHSVRAFLRSDDEGLELLAITAVGTLEDYDAVPELMDRVEHGDVNAMRTGFAALRRITRMTLRSDLDLWERWYAEESTWWDGKAARCFHLLDRGETRDIAFVINEISQRSLRRHELAAALLPCLDHPEPAIVVLACEALGGLGSPRALPDLVACLERAADPEATAAAWKALRRISGRNLPRDPRAWSWVFE